MHDKPWNEISEKTIDFYNRNADAFVNGTVSVDFRLTQDKFLGRLDKGAYILDFGCGSGRDAKYFLSQGFQVDAIDGSAEMCRIARQYTGIKVKQMLFHELDEHEKYDGIWACASILHLPRCELKSVFKKLIVALKAAGIIYTSFKYGEFEGERHGRYFTDFTAETFTDFIRDMDYLKILDYWITNDVRPEKREEKWLNLILQKN